MIETPYTRKYNLANRINNLDKGKLAILQAMVDDIIDRELRNHRDFGVPVVSRYFKEYVEYPELSSDPLILDKKIVGYCIDINPKTKWKNCNCGGTGNWRVR